MKLKLTSGDGAIQIIECKNPIEFALKLGCDDTEEELLVVSDELWDAYNHIDEMVYAGYEKDDECMRASHCNPMNPDENFTLELA